MVYLLHFDEPLCHAKHYIGYTDDLDKRMETHRAGRGSKLVRAVMENDSDFVVARTWENGDRTFERHLKDQKNGPRFCPICQAKLRGE